MGTLRQIRSPLAEPASGTTKTLRIGGSRIQSLAYANGYLLGVSEVMPSGATTPEIHWFKLDVTDPGSPQLVIQGDISGDAIGAGVAVFNLRSRSTRTATC
jgi:hypothetical protein